MVSSKESEIKFELLCETNFGEEICVVGNIPSLGCWNPSNGIRLKTDCDNYPNWYSESPLMLQVGVKFQFKFVKISTQDEKHRLWECFSNDSNRNYRTRYHAVTLKAVWNDFSGRELTTKKYASSSNAFDDDDNSELQVQKFKISGLFVPYEQDGGTSDDSDFDDDQQITASKPRRSLKRREDHHNIQQTLLATKHKQMQQQQQQEVVQDPEEEFFVVQKLKNCNRTSFQDITNINQMGGEQVQQNEFKRVKVGATSSPESRKWKVLKGNKQANNTPMFKTPKHNGLSPFRTAGSHSQSREDVAAYCMQDSYDENQLNSSNSSDDDGDDLISEFEKERNNNQSNQIESHVRRDTDQKGEIAKERRGSPDCFLAPTTHFVAKDAMKVQVESSSQSLMSQDENQWKGQQPRRVDQYVRNGGFKSKFKGNNFGDANNDVGSSNDDKDEFAQKLFLQSGHRIQQILLTRKAKYSQRNGNIVGPPVKYSFLRNENDIFFEVSEEFLVNMSRNDTMCFATLFLPLTLSYDEATDTITDSLFQNTLDFHFLGAYESLTRVGVIPNQGEIPASMHDRVRSYLMQKYRFFPIFIEQRLLDSFLNQFCENLFDDIMTNNFNIHTYKCSEFHAKLMEDVKMLNFIFAAEMSKIINEDTNVVIGDYRIVFAITYLAQYNARKMKIVYFHQHAFPSVDTLGLLPFSDKLILAILCANMISFANYENAQNFLQYIRVNMKLDCDSQRGNLAFVYMGNQIGVQIRSPGVCLKKIQAAITEIKTIENKMQELVQAEPKQAIQKAQPGIVFLSVDHLHERSRILLNLKLFERFKSNHENLNPTLIQLILINSGEERLDRKEQQLLQKINLIAEEINQKQSSKESDASVTVISKNLSLSERIEYMRKANVFVRSGNYEFSEIFVLEYLMSSKHDGFCLLNKSGGPTFKSLRSCITFNASSYVDFECRVFDVLQMPLRLKRRVCEKDREIVGLHHSTSIWVEKHIGELKKNAKFMSHANLTGFNKGINFQKVAHHPNFKRINLRETSELYRKTQKRLIIFGYVGTIVPLDKYMYIQAEEHQVRRHISKPTEKMLESLSQLCSDKRNLVYILSEQPSDFIAEWFSEVKGLGIICEDGFLHKVIQEDTASTSTVSSITPWMRLIDIDLSWKSSAYRIMERYATHTQGSSVEVKESAITWKYSKVPVDYGAKQASVLLQQLSTQLNLPNDFEIIHNLKESIEIKPRSINKGIMTEVLIERMEQEYGSIDYLMAFGSSMTDEDIFGACQNYSRRLRSREFADLGRLRAVCVKVGIKPSNANTHIEFDEIANFLEQLVLSQSFAPAVQ